MPTLATCRCGRTWTGTVSAHCSVCHRHFSTVKNFDLHKPDRRGCGNPETMTRTKKDGTVLPLFKAVEILGGTTFVTYVEPGQPDEVVEVDE